MSSEHSEYAQIRSIARKVESIHIYKYFFFCILSIIATWSTWSKVSRGEFSIIDDHGILPFIGDNYISPSDFLNVLIGSTEIGQWGESIRYRPVSIFVQFVHIVFFNETAAFYYLGRLTVFVLASSIFLATISAVFFGVNRYIKFGVISATAFTFSNLPAWGDILNRLGPSEIYEILLLVLLLNYGLKILMRTDIFRNYILFLVIGTIFYGTKEDALIAMPFAALVGLIGFRNFPVKRMTLILATFINLAFGAFVSVGVTIALSKNNGSDVYGNSRGILKVFEFTISAITSISFVITLMMWLIAGILLKNAAAKIEGHFLGLRKLSILTASVLVLWIWEHIFYSNSFGGSFNRYSIVSQVLFLFIGLIYFGELCRLIKFLKPCKPMKLGFLVSLLIPTITYFVIGPVHNQLKAINDLRINETINFSSNLSKAKVSSKSMNQIRLISIGPGDYERIYSINKYFDAKEISLPVYLDYNSGIENLSSDLDSSLDSQLKIISKDGNRGWGIEPKLDSKTGLELCISFTQVPSFPDSCTQSLNILAKKGE
jgi:hypothetical protein